ncbi:MAG TPA: S49 family peptidase [Chthonomonadales bacterium]|nr:S49 family peptidase [Chthonomonadales bacterium]
MNYPRIFERVYLNPVCVSAERFASIHAFLLPRLTGKAPLELHAAGQDFNQRKTRSPYNAKRSQRAAPVVNPMTGAIIDPRFYTSPMPGVAVVPVYGVLAKNLSAWEEDCGGGTDINAPMEALRQALAAPEIQKIALDMDSPGGEVTGIPEFASAIAAAAQVKRVEAFTDAGACSACYWLASQCSAFHVTRSSTVGSVGTYLAWLDESIKMELEGVALQLFAAGKHKGIGLPGRPLSTDDRALLQARVDRINGWFTSSVQHGRAQALCVADIAEVIDPACLEGQTFSGEQAIENGMADSIVSGWDEFLERFAAA